MPKKNTADAGLTRSKRSGKTEGQIQPQQESLFPHMQKRYSLSKVGLVCTNAKCTCLRCGRQKEISFDEKELDNVVSPLCVGDGLIEYEAKMYGWLLLSGVAVRGQCFQYALCPLCIETDIENFLRIQALD